MEIIEGKKKNPSFSKKKKLKFENITRPMNKIKIERKLAHEIRFSKIIRRIFRFKKWNLYRYLYLNFFFRWWTAG